MPPTKTNAERAEATPGRGASGAPPAARIPNAASTSESAEPMPASAVVACQNLTKVFKDFWMRSRARAVDNVSFHINRGEIFGVLGPNGSGKSTTIKIILGLLHKTSGRVAVFGKLPSDVAIKRRVGYLPEESYLYPFLNARETLDYYGKLFELDPRVRKRRIDELLDMVGLTGVQFRQVREYSKGMQRRIGLAQALINDPELLILDEPTTGLDPIGTRQVKDLIIQLGHRGKTILLSSHLLADVEDCVDRMIILYGGRIRREGTCEQLLDSTDRSVIETETLDDETVAEIDAVLRKRTGGGVAKVSRPRQRLEDLFVDIVEQAQAEQVETSGAKHTGSTAAFLRGQEASGDELISSLITGDEQAEEELTLNTGASKDRAAATPQPAGPDDNILGELLRPEPDHQPGTTHSGGRSQSSQQPPPPPQDIDAGVIGDLLDPGTSAGDNASERRS